MLSGAVPYPREFAERYVNAGYWRPETLGGLLREQSLKFAERNAVASKTRSLRYDELNLLSDRLALHLLEKGFRPGDIVLLQLPNIWEFYVIFLALAKIGVLPVMCL